MKKTLPILAVVISAAFQSAAVQAADPVLSFTRLWTHTHTTAGQTSEISAFDHKTNTLWVVGIVGVDVLDATTGTLIEHIDTTGYGSVNSVAIHNGLAALAIEATTRTSPGVVVFYDTRTRALSSGVNMVTVGALPDMLTFTHDGSKLLVANEGTPSTYGPRIGTSVPRVYGPAPSDPAGSVSIIDVASRSVIATATLDSVPVVGSNARLATGMDFEPEYIAVDKDDEKAYVTLQEANAMGVLDLGSNTFTQIVGLGLKDFSATGNQIDPLNNGTVAFISPSVRGLYMPDAIAAYQSKGNTYVVMANEGDFREDDADRSAASGLNAVSPLNNLRVSNADSSPGNLVAAGARSFSIRDAHGNLVYDSGDFLDKKADALGVYDDGRSRDKGVEPEGVALLDIAGRTYAFIGLERTTKASVAVFDVENPAKPVFVQMIVTDGDVGAEGLATFHYRGNFYLSIANEVSATTTLYRIDRGN